MTPRMGRHLELCEGLIQALESDQLVLHYQPVLDLRRGDVAAVEALIRWQHPQHGLVGPLDFIPTAESTGQIIEVGAWALREACRQAQAWRQAGLPVRLAVNLSARQFSAPDLVECVERALRDTEMPPGMLELELTESMFAEPPTSTIILESVRELGVRVAIDDFGTGFSSLSYLTRFSLDTIKIDRSFIEEAVQDRHAATIVGFVIAMAHELDLQVIAEGVETEAQERLLVAHNCDLSQGFLHSPPLSASECERWMRQRIARPLTPIPGGGDSGDLDLDGNGSPEDRRHRGGRSRRRFAAGARA